MSATPSSFWRENSRRERATQDRRLPVKGYLKAARIDLGLQLLALRAGPGVILTHQDIAAWCGCTRDAIYLIEKRALWKVRNKLKFGVHAKMGREIAA